MIVYGVAAFVRSSFQVDTLITPHEKKEYEALWLRIHTEQSSFIIGAIYHPPKPLYDTKDFMDYLTSTLDFFMSSHPNSSVILAGDLNQLSDTDLRLRTGLRSVVKLPTRGPSFLDRVYVSHVLELDVKVTKSAIKSDHSAIIVHDGHVAITNVLKQKTVVSFRRKSPAQHASFLSAAANVSFAPVIDECDIQLCADNFYTIANDLFNCHYPLRTITLSESYLPFVTPEVKLCSHQKNKLMRAGKIEQAGAMAEKIGKCIARF